MSTVTDNSMVSPASASSAPVAAGATAPSDAKQTTAVNIDDIITGRPLKFPIHDKDGTLLLAEGAIVTSEFKQRLRSHNITQVGLHREDIDNLTLLGMDGVDSNFKFDNETTQRLDSLIESGSLFVANNGPAMREQLTTQGSKAYDNEAREKLVKRHTEVSESLDNMIHDALHGASMDGSKLLNTTADYLSAMTIDIDNVLTVANEVDMDGGLADHCLQMSLLGMAIGIEMGMDESNVRTIGLCGLLHDWGMVKVPKEIRTAQRVLSTVEFIEIKKHPIYSLDLLKKLSGIPGIVPLICYQVHERPNGSGYPRERQKNTIHAFARILGVADAFIALTRARPYRRPLMPYAAIECMLHMAKSRALDPDVVRALLQVVSLFPIGSFVTLSDGSVARVIRRNGAKYATPVVQRIQDGRGGRVSVTDENAIVALGEGELRVVQALPTPGKQEIALSPDIIEIKRS